MIISIPYINLLKLSWIVKSIFLRNMEPLITMSATEKTEKPLKTRNTTASELTSYQTKLQQTERI